MNPIISLGCVRKSPPSLSLSFLGEPLSISRHRNHCDHRTFGEVVAAFALAAHAFPSAPYCSSSASGGWGEQAPSRPRGPTHPFRAAPSAIGHCCLLHLLSVPRVNAKIQPASAVRAQRTHQLAVGEPNYEKPLFAALAGRGRESKRGVGSQLSPLCCKWAEGEDRGRVASNSSPTADGHFLLAASGFSAALRVVGLAGLCRR